jgi:hypothetical protein
MGRRKIGVGTKTFPRCGPLPPILKVKQEVKNMELKNCLPRRCFASVASGKETEGSRICTTEHQDVFLKIAVSKGFSG